MDFVKSLETARKVPDEADSVFNPFAPPQPARTGAPLVDTTASPDRIEGLPAYPGLTYFCRRFYIGRELKEIIDNSKIFEDRDESDELKAVMDKQLQGKAVIWSKKETILGEGSVVIWLEWSEKSGVAAPQAPRLGLADLLSSEKVPSQKAPVEEPNFAPDEDLDDDLDLDGCSGDDGDNW